MIVTESFVWINYPKSGSTFVRRALRELYKNYRKDEEKRSALSRMWRSKPKRWIEELSVPEKRLRSSIGMHGETTPHGLVSQIPKQYRHLPVASSYRDPFERLKSAYRYGNWRKPIVHRAPLDEIREAFPKFPELDFREYAEMVFRFDTLRVTIGSETVFLGPFSGDFLKFFSAGYVDPDQGVVHSNWDEFEDSIAPVRFIRQSTLNADLVDLLTRLGHQAHDVAFILEKEKQNVSNASGKGDDGEEAEVRRIVSQDRIYSAMIDKYVNGLPVSLKEFSL